MSAIFPIREISTYNGRNWTIRGRVTAKSSIRSFTNDRGAGKVFSVDLLDKDGGEIKASFFNASVDKFFDQIEAGKVYTLSKGSVKVANKRFSTSKHNYEISFDADAVIVESEDKDDADKIDAVKYTFTKIREVSSKSLPCTIDLVGVVRDVKPIGKITPKNSSEELVRRTVTVVDTSECSIDITLWQDHATKLDEAVLLGKPVIAFKGLSVKEYNGSRSLSTMQQTMMTVVTPDLQLGQVATETAAWWASGPSAVGDFFNLSSTSAVGGTPGISGGGNPDNRTAACSIADMKEECKRGLFGDKGLFFDIVAKLSFVSTKAKDAEIPIFYSACSSCNRKLSDDGTNRCFACDKIVPAPKLKYLLRAQFIDHTDQCYLSVFDAQAVGILKRPVEELVEASKAGSSIGEELKKSFFQRSFLLRVKATAQEFKGEMRPRITVIAAEPLDALSRGNKLLKKIFDKVGRADPDVKMAADDKENVKVEPDVKMADDKENVEDEPDCKKMRVDSPIAAQE